MARLARVVASGLPHHITQRGNRWQASFFSKAESRFPSLRDRGRGEVTTLRSLLDFDELHPGSPVH